jgi:hypothetical protein
VLSGVCKAVYLLAALPGTEQSELVVVAMWIGGGGGTAVVWINTWDVEPDDAGGWEARLPVLVLTVRCRKRGVIGYDIGASSVRRQWPAASLPGMSCLWKRIRGLPQEGHVTCQKVA